MYCVYNTISKDAFEDFFRLNAIYDMFFSAELLALFFFPRFFFNMEKKEI